jgi:hypothetical protein
MVQKAMQEKTAAITRAEGEAQAAKIISDALLKSGAGLVEVRRRSRKNKKGEKRLPAAAARRGLGGGVGSGRCIWNPICGAVVGSRSLPPRLPLVAAAFERRGGRRASAGVRASALSG